MTSLAFYNLKGGVGKTTTCVNLAYLSAQEGYRTLLWDVDPQGAASFYCRSKGNGLNGHAAAIFTAQQSIRPHVETTEYPNLDLISGDTQIRDWDLLLASLEKRKRLKNVLDTLRSEYDYIFIDCPPTLSRLAENLFRGADFVLFPMIPSPLSQRTYQQVTDFFAQKDFDARKLFPFFNLVDRRRTLHKSIMADFHRALPRTLNTYLPNSAAVERMGTEQQPLPAYADRHPVTADLRQLWQEIKLLRKPKSRKRIAAGRTNRRRR